MLRSDLCNYSGAYILVNGTITVAGNHDRDRQNKPVILKNNAPFISCITKINNKLIDDAEDLDVVMPILIMFKVILVKKCSISHIIKVLR